MKKYELSVNTANSKVLKWLDEVANARIHQTTLQRPIELLSEEITYLNVIPKPYMGISHRVLIKRVSNNVLENKRLNMAFHITRMAPRDMLNYDSLIPRAIDAKKLSSCKEKLAWR